MNKILEGKVISNKMQSTVVIEVIRRKAHPLYKKIFRVSKKFKASTNGITVSLGDVVRIEEVRPISKDIHFKVITVVKKVERKEIQ